MGIMTQKTHLLLLQKDRFVIRKTGGSMFRGMYKDQPTKGVTFQYECFQLMKLDKMIRISKTKNVKHNGKFYYAMYVDGQLQLAE